MEGLVTAKLIPPPPPLPPTGKVEDLGTGEYSATFFAAQSGAYQVSVMHNGTNVAGSPFTAHVAPAAVEPGCCLASGEGMLVARCGRKVWDWGGEGGARVFDVSEFESGVVRKPCTVIFWYVDPSTSMRQPFTISYLFRTSLYVYCLCCKG